MGDPHYDFRTLQPWYIQNEVIGERSEEVYDAMNDETFGSVISCDWEETHECLVNLKTTAPNGYLSNCIVPLRISNTNSLINSKQINEDLELNLSRIKLD